MTHKDRNWQITSKLIWASSIRCAESRKRKLRIKLSKPGKERRRRNERNEPKVMPHSETLNAQFTREQQRKQRKKRRTEHDDLGFPESGLSDQRAEAFQDFPAK